jgi:hypothetical protein
MHDGAGSLTDPAVELSMRTISVLVALLLSVRPASAQQVQQPIQESAENAIARMVTQEAQKPSEGSKGKLFWPGVLVGVAGATTSVLGLTVFKVTDTSSGGAPRGAYQACVQQAATNPLYATSDCNALKGKNLKLLWGGVAVGVVGAGMIIGSLNTSAEIGPGAVRFSHRIRF